MTYHSPNHDHFGSNVLSNEEHMHKSQKKHAQSQGIEHPGPDEIAGLKNKNQACLGPENSLFVS